MNLPPSHNPLRDIGSVGLGSAVVAWTWAICKSQLDLSLGLLLGTVTLFYFWMALRKPKKNAPKLVFVCNRCGVLEDLKAEEAHGVRESADPDPPPHPEGYHVWICELREGKLKEVGDGTS